MTLPSWMQRLIARPNQLYGASIARVFVAIAGLHFYISQFAVRDVLWGVGSQDSDLQTGLPHLMFGNPGRLLVSVCIAILIAGLFLVYGGRPLAIIHGLVLLLFHRRNPLILDGGDNFIEIVIWFLPLLITNAYLAPQAQNVRRRLEAIRGRASPMFLIHNLALFLIAFQISVVYTIAGLAKVISPPWREGIALYLVSRMDEFRYLTLLTKGTTNPFVVTFLSYATVVVQLSFVPLVLNKKTRAIGVVNVAMMHVGIIFAMGLVGFGLSMFSGLAVVFPEQMYHWLRGRLRGVRRSILRDTETIDISKDSEKPSVPDAALG